MPATIVKVLHGHGLAASSGAPVPAAWALRPGDVILVDEAGMAGTPALGRLLALAQQCGALVRLLGDTMQLIAVEALRRAARCGHAGPTAQLDRVHGFLEAPAGQSVKNPVVSRNRRQPGRRYEQPPTDDLGIAVPSV